MKRTSAYIRRNRPGQMLLEVIIAMGVLVLFATGIMTLVLSGYDGRGRAEDRIVASYAATEGLEATRSRGWNSFDTLKDGTYGFDEQGKLVDGFTGTIQDRFSQEVTVSSESDDNVRQTKRVESTVSWALSEGGDHAQVTLETFLTNWRRPRWLTDLTSDFEEGGINAMELTEEGDGGVALRAGGNFLQPQILAQIPVQSRISDLHVDPVRDLLYVLTDENPLGPELLVYDVSNVSGSGTLKLVAEQELIKDGIRFVFGKEYAYILTGHSDREVVVLRLADNTLINSWDIEGDAVPRDIAIDEASGKAYVTLSTAEERIPQVIARGDTEEPEASRTLFSLWQKFEDGIVWIAERLPGISRVFAQGAPTCNGQTATIYVSGGLIVGGPNNGLPYVAGVTTLAGTDSTSTTDVIVGTSGNDIIQGQRGPDIICGGDGDDYINGDNQNDIIFGEGGNDTINGGSQNDIICGAAGNDTLSGDNNNDSIAGGAGTDTVNGGGGTDVCREGESLSNCEDTTSAIATCGVSVADTTPPTVSTLSPSDNATNVAIGANLVITFNEAVTAVTGNVTIKKSIDNSTVETISVTSGKLSGSGTSTITLNPATDLAYSTSYYIQIDATAFDDLAGNSFAGISTTTTWNFTTTAAPDTTPPTVSTLSPADNATDVSISSNLVITFNEAVTAVTGNVTIKKASDDSTVETISVTSGQLSGSGTSTITLNPVSDLVYNTSYYILIASTAFDDLSGNGYAGIGSSTVWNFTTAAEPDTTAPTVSTLSPADDATDVAIASNLVITFSESVTPVSGNIIIKEFQGNTTVETIAVTSGLVTGSGTDTITINPSSDLSYNTHYFIEIDATAFDDLAGNSYDGISNKNTWDFTTSAAPDTTQPTISTLSPTDDATGVSFNPTLTISFSEAVTAVSGNVTIKKSSDNTTVEAISVTSGQLSGSGTATITLDPAVTLDSLTAYYIQIDASAFDDLAGNGFAGISDTTTWNFSTASSDTTNPSISTLSPADDATEVANTTDLVITFDESVNVETGNITVKLASGDSTVETIDVTSANVTGDGTSTITVDIANLALGTAYYVNIDATAFDDLAGNSFAGISDTTTWNFTTAEEEVVVEAPQISRAERIRQIAQKVYVFDVSNPEATNAEAQVSQVNVGNTGEAIETFGRFVVLATSNVSAELQIIDTNTSKVERCDLPGQQIVRDMRISGNRLYLTRTEGPEEEFTVYDIDEDRLGNCASLLAGKARGIQLADDARAMTMLPRENIAFILGDFMESAVQVIDLAAEERSGWLRALLAPLAIAQHTPVTFLQGFNGICDGIDTVGSYVYAGCRTKDDKTMLTIIGGERGSEERFQWGSFTAPPFDSGSEATVWKRITWEYSNESPVTLRIRMAATENDLKTAPWVGIDGSIGTPFAENEGEEIVRPVGTSGTRWIQWKAYFEDSADVVPVLEDVILTFDQPS